MVALFPDDGADDKGVSDPEEVIGGVMACSSPLSESEELNVVDGIDGTCGTALMASKKTRLYFLLTNDHASVRKC